MDGDDNRAMIRANTSDTSNRTTLAVIRVQGEDAVTFLQGQLSNDFCLLSLHQWQLAAYCNAKGRMLASVWGYKLSQTDVILVLSQDIAAQTRQRLSMFVLRAKVQLSDASDMLPVLLAEHGLRAWSEHEVTRGVARITAPLVDLFVPQMLNYESIGGVSFKKGCYPGQEVIARSQFRGTIKRRTYLVQPSSPMPEEAIGQNVYADSCDDPVGVVLQIDSDKEGQTLALICLQVAYAACSLHWNQTNSRITLRMLAQPYPLLED